MAISLPEFPTFDANRDPTSIAQRWNKWVDRYENLLVAIDITKPERKKALLLHYAGEGVQEIYETLPTPSQDSEDPADAYTIIKQQLNNHFCPKKNVEFEVYMFRQAIDNSRRRPSTSIAPG